MGSVVQLPETLGSRSRKGACYSPIGSGHLRPRWTGLGRRHPDGTVCVSLQIRPEPLPCVSGCFGPTIIDKVCLSRATAAVLSEALTVGGESASAGRGGNAVVRPAVPGGLAAALILGRSLDA